MWGNSKSPSSTGATTNTDSTASRPWSWDDTNSADTLESTSFSTSIDINDTPSSPEYTVLAGVTDGGCHARKSSLEGDPVESAIAEWEMDLGESTASDVTASDVANDVSFDSTMCTSVDESMLKQEDSFVLNERPVRAKKGQTRLKAKVTKPGSRENHVNDKLESTSEPRALVRTRGSSQGRAVARPIGKTRFSQRHSPSSSSLQLTRICITSEAAFHHRFLECEERLHTLAEAYLRSKRQDVPWTNDALMDHALFDWAFVSRKSGLPRAAAISSLCTADALSTTKRPVRWTPCDDRLIMYLKEIEGLTWKESALMIRYRHSWQAVQMRYLRTLCRLTGKWTKQETDKLKSVVARDWAGRWRRIATEMGPQFPAERVYRQMMGLAGMEVDLERLDGVEGEEQGPSALGWEELVQLYNR